MNEESACNKGASLQYVEKQINWEDVIAIIDTLHYPNRIMSVQIDPYKLSITYKTPTI